MSREIYFVLVVLFTICHNRFSEANFTLKIIHFNDLHARYDEITNSSTPCIAGESQNCMAGIARLATTVSKLRKESNNHLVLNAGDVFQGTIWYNLMKWNVSQFFMKNIAADAMTLGNHEFDDGIKGLLPFLEALKGVTPVAVSNLQIPKTNIKELKDLNSLVQQEPLKVTVDGHVIGIIGVIYDETNKIADTDPVTFKNSVDSVRQQAKLLKEDGVDKVIVLSHCGILEDKRIAEQAGDDIDIIVGGHSHTLLYSGIPPHNQAAFDTYPIVVNLKNNHKVLIVQAFCHGMFVGNLDVTFDSKGEIVAHKGVPVYQDSGIEKDDTFDKYVQDFKKDIDEKSSAKIGETELVLDHEKCREQECKMGSALADAYLWYYKDDPQPPRLAMIHPGNFRTTLSPKVITRGQVLTAMPFRAGGNRVTISGSVIKQALEYGATLSKRCRYNVVQVAGIKVSIDFAKEKGSRASIEVNIDGGYKSLELSKNYTIIVNAYMLKGGDGFDMFQNTISEKWGPTDSEMFEKYISESKGIKVKSFEQPRIRIENNNNAVKELDRCKVSRRK
uniref:Apyrase n=1 Tax=Psorophora albipes TaxID=869069 RepID=T1DI12_9DIPT